MKIRELLQIEIWSKRTTRRLFIGFVIVVAAVLTWFGVSGYWLTPGEREAGRTALAQIDSLRAQGFRGDPKNFEARKQKVQQAVEKAEHAAWTTRDKRIAQSLSLYLTLVDLAWGDIEQNRLLEQRNFKNSNPQFSPWFQKQSAASEELFSLRLHTVLGS